MMSPSATARWRTSSATTLLQVRGRDSSPSSTSHAGEPTGYAEAKGDPAWEAAMKQELQAVEKNKTWELV